ncbi:ChaN family lipoprotein [Marinobacter sp. NSM]|uniref:ChaN family lipoprotein n=1 Tax=Marinobacter sp. NSM TaxID=3458004 RepID=UPI004036BDF1
MASPKRFRHPLLAICLALMAGCAQLPQPSDTESAQLKTLYDSALVDSQSGQLLSLEDLARALAKADVVVIGEYHGHQASHLLQARLQQRLYQQRPRQVLTLEQFNLDHQPALDSYLAGMTGETEMIEDASAWDNYRGSYRPLVEFARRHDLPVLAANAPADVVRCVGRTGPDYLERLPANQRQTLPEQPFRDTPAYREKFVEAISGSHGQGDPSMAERMDNTYKAQLLRDNTMAMRILQARQQHPDHQVVHLTGTFHSEQGLGTVALLKQQAPELSVAVISPVFWPDDESQAPLASNLDKGDYLYLIQTLPPEFRDTDRRKNAMRERFRSGPEVHCITE